MADTYSIFGISGDTPVLLHTTDSCGDADRWIKGYTRQGDWGGYGALSLYEVGQGQESETIYLHDCPIDTWYATDAT